MAWPAVRTQLLPAAFAARSARSAWRIVVGTSSAGSSSVTPTLPETPRTTPERVALAAVRGVHRPELGDDPLGERRRLVQAVGDQDGELVATQPADQVAVPDRRPQPRGHLDEQVVPRLVAGDVVDRLEAVEVEQQQARRRAASGDAGARRGRAPPSAGPGWAGRSGSRCRPGARARARRSAGRRRRAGAGPARPGRCAGAGPAPRDDRREPVDSPAVGPSRTAATTRRGRAAGTPARGCRPASAAGSSARYSSCRSSSWTKSRSRRALEVAGRPAEALGAAVDAQVTCPRSSSTIVTSAERCTSVRKKASVRSTWRVRRAPSRPRPGCARR